MCFVLCVEATVWEEAAACQRVDRWACRGEEGDKVNDQTKGGNVHSNASHRFPLPFPFFLCLCVSFAPVRPLSNGGVGGVERLAWGRVVGLGRLSGRGDVNGCCALAHGAAWRAVVWDGCGMGGSCQAAW